MNWVPHLGQVMEIFAAALGHAYLLAAVRAGKIAVGFAQGKPLLQLAELGAPHQRFSA